MCYMGLAARGPTRRAVCRQSKMLHSTSSFSAPIGDSLTFKLGFCGEAVSGKPPDLHDKRFLPFIFPAANVKGYPPPLHPSIVPRGTSC